MMKIYRIIIAGICIVIALKISVKSQNVAMLSNDSSRLQKVIEGLRSGVFVRTMDQFDPDYKGKDSTKIIKKAQNPTQLTNTYYFFRFDSLWPSQIHHQVYLAKLFVSERVFEKVFFKKYLTEADYKSAVAGMYIMARVYLEGRNDELLSSPRINIFPTYTTNITTKKMYHGVSSTKDYPTHLRRLIREVEDDDQDSTFFKEIKCFDIELRDDKLEGLRLAYTKYSRSDDRITNSSYFLKFDLYKTSTINPIVTQQLKQDNRKLADQSVTMNSALNATQNAKPMVVIDSINTNKPDTLVALQTVIPEEAWVYAGMITRDSAWVTQYVKNYDGNGQVVEALYRLQLRAGAPIKENTAWRKEKVIYICEKGQKMEVLKREYIPNHKNGDYLLWLKVKLL